VKQITENKEIMSGILQATVISIDGKALATPTIHVFSSARIGSLTQSGSDCTFTYFTDRGGAYKSTYLVEEPYNTIADAMVLVDTSPGGGYKIPANLVLEKSGREYTGDALPLLKSNLLLAKAVGSTSLVFTNSPNGTDVSGSIVDTYLVNVPIGTLKLAIEPLP
jgi:hypothetical protein